MRHDRSLDTEPRPVAARPSEKAGGAGRIHLTRIPTPLGPVLAGATGEAVCLLEFGDRPGLEVRVARMGERLGAAVGFGESEATRRLAHELEAYFAGALRDFSLPLFLQGTPFQEAVWRELQTIPYGTTRSYGEQARRMGRPDAVRAVARANGDNPIAILIPCHRVIGSDGKLTGYGGGLERKKRLLELEGGQLAAL